MKMKTSELKGAPLDWAVWHCEYQRLLALKREMTDDEIAYLLKEPFSPTTDWAVAGPIIEREKIDTAYSDGNGEEWSAYSEDGNFDGFGSTTRIAAMRCYVSSVLGEEVEIPKSLLS